METKKFKTTTGVEIELKTYLTGREIERLSDVFLANAELRGKGTEMEITGIKGSDFTRYMHKKIEMTVVSVNGQTENILDRILDLPGDDYRKVIAEVNKIADISLFIEKKS